MTRHAPTRRTLLIGGAASAAALAAPLKPVGAAAPATHQVVIQRFRFTPQTVTVRVGDSIEWLNEDLAPHTATADEAGWDTGELAKGEQASVIVTEGMETSYFCAFHPRMKGTIEIVSP